MFNPMQAYHAADHQPIEYFNDLDEEQSGQRYGHLVRIPSLWSRFSLRLGKLLIRIGERLTGEYPSVELSRETA